MVEREEHLKILFADGGAIIFVDEEHEEGQQVALSPESLGKMVAQRYSNWLETMGGSSMIRTTLGTIHHQRRRAEAARKKKGDEGTGSPQ